MRCTHSRMGLDGERLLILVLVGLLVGLVVVLARNLVLDGVHDVGHDVQRCVGVWRMIEWCRGRSEGYVAPQYSYMYVPEPPRSRSSGSGR